MHNFFINCSAVRAAEFLADGYRIVTNSDDQTTLLWDLASGEKISSFHEHQVSCPYLSSRNSQFIGSEISFFNMEQLSTWTVYTDIITYCILNLIGMRAHPQEYAILNSILLDHIEILVSDSSTYLCRLFMKLL